MKDIYCEIWEGNNLLATIDLHFMPFVKDDAITIDGEYYRIVRISHEIGRLIGYDFKYSKCKMYVRNLEDDI